MAGELQVEADMRGPRTITVIALLILVGTASHAGNFDFIEQNGTVTATADGNTVTEVLPKFQPTTLTVTAGTNQPGMDYGTATIVSAVHGNRIHLTLDASVGEWGNEGSAEARIVVVFVVNQTASFTIDVETADATGNGWLGERSFITLSNDDGIIFRRNSGGGYDSCDRDHPDQTLCETRTLTPDTYYFEMVASAYAPKTCGSCKGYAVTAQAELDIRL